MTKHTKNNVILHWGCLGMEPAYRMGSPATALAMQYHYWVISTPTNGAGRRLQFPSHYCLSNDKSVFVPNIQTLGTLPCLGEISLQTSRLKFQLLYLQYPAILLIKQNRHGVPGWLGFPVGISIYKQHASFFSYNLYIKREFRLES